MKKREPPAGKDNQLGVSAPALTVPRPLHGAVLADAPAASSSHVEQARVHTSAQPLDVTSFLFGLGIGLICGFMIRDSFWKW